VPSSAAEWLTIANTFHQKWQYPNCSGAIDGKHIVIQPPPNADLFIFLQLQAHPFCCSNALAGPDYQCLYADIGTKGRISDGGSGTSAVLQEH